MDPPTTTARRVTLRKAPSRRFRMNEICYISAQTRRIVMALTMLDKHAETSTKAAWPAEIAAEFDRESKNPNPCVGSELVSESNRVRSG
jgi:hypothetical protein